MPGGEIASLFVRIRPDVTGFAAEATTAVKASLEEIQGQVTAAANAQIAETKAMVKANMGVAASYKAIGDAADAGSYEQQIAYAKAVDAAKTAASLMVDSSDEAVAGTLKQIDENAKLSASYIETGDAAKRSALAQLAAIKGSTSSVGGGGGASGVAKVGEDAKKSDGPLETLRKHLFNFYTLLDAGIGGYFAVDFIKDVTSAAAGVQKSQEVVQDEFGKSAATISQFATTSAQGLGITDNAAESTAAKFGILFKSLNIAQPAAAQMTVGWEKLVGAIAQLRGVDPTSLLANITNAAAGNTRGLKQLGIVVNTATLEQEAFQLGLTKTSTQALSPGQKAIATYAEATANLSTFQQQAAAHANDYANVQIRLSTAWSNAKDIIGEQLLPSFTKYVGELSNWLSNLSKSGALQKDVNSDLQKAGSAFNTIKGAVEAILKPIESLIGLLGGAKQATEIFIAAWSIEKLAGIASAIQNNLIKAGIDEIGPRAVVASAAYDASLGDMEIATAGLTATIKGALISTGIGALVVAAGIAAVEIIQHWNTVKVWLAAFGQWIEQNAEALFAIPIVGQFAYVAVEVVKHFDAIRSAAEKLGADLKEIFKNPVKGIEDTFRDMGKIIEDVFVSVGHAILIQMAGTVSAILGLIAKIPTSFNTHIPGVGRVGGTNPAIALKASFDAYVKNLELMEAASKTGGSDAADKFAGAFGSAGSISTVTAAAKKVGKAVHDTVATAATGDNGLNNQKMEEALADSIFNTGIANSIKDAKTKLADAISSNNQKIKDAQTSLGDYIVSGTQRIQKAMTDNNATLTNLGKQADTNLTSIAKKLATDAGDLIQKNIDLGTLPANAALNASLTALQTNLLSGKAQGNLALLTQQAQALTSQVDVKGNTATLKDTVEQHVEGIVTSLQTGKVGIKSAMKEITDYLNSQGITFKTAGKLLGSTFAEGMTADLKAIATQYDQIGLLPKSIRDAASKATSAGAGPKIVDVKDEIAKLRSSLDTATATYKKTLTEKEAKLKVTISDSDKAIAQAKEHATQTYQTDALRVAEHHYQEAIKQTALLTKIAASNASLAALSTNTSGFKSSTVTNPGNASHNARAAAKRGA